MEQFLESLREHLGVRVALIHPTEGPCLDEKGTLLALGRPVNKNKRSNSLAVDRTLDRGPARELKFVRSGRRIFTTVTSLMAYLSSPIREDVL